MEIRGQIHAPAALLPRKKLRVSIVYKAGSTLQSRRLAMAVSLVWRFLLCPNMPPYDTVWIIYGLDKEID
jgi:hypothetical protein